jgi:hypothetical protein
MRVEIQDSSLLPRGHGACPRLRGLAFPAAARSERLNRIGQDHNSWGSLQIRLGVGRVVGVGDGDRAPEEVDGQARGDHADQHCGSQLDRRNDPAQQEAEGHPHPDDNQLDQYIEDQQKHQPHSKPRFMLEHPWTRVS